MGVPILYFSAFSSCSLGGHHVVTTGPYRFVHRPRYTSAFWAYLATRIFLDSFWALIPALLGFGILILRTSLEDRTLQADYPATRISPN